MKSTAKRGRPRFSTKPLANIFGAKRARSLLDMLNMPTNVNVDADTLLDHVGAVIWRNPSQLLNALDWLRDRFLQLNPLDRQIAGRVIAALGIEGLIDGRGIGSARTLNLTDTHPVVPWVEALIQEHTPTLIRSSDRLLWEALPDFVIAYRGTYERSGDMACLMGRHWSRCPKRAAQFVDHGALYVAQVPHHEILYYTDVRDEQELILAAGVTGSRPARLYEARPEILQAFQQELQQERAMRNHQQSA